MDVSSYEIAALVFLLVYLGLALAVAQAAVSRGHERAEFLMIGVLLTPIASLILLLVRGRRTPPVDTR